YNRIELFSFISEITLYENDSNKKVKLFWGATIHESGTKNYSKTVHVLAVRTQFVQWEHKLNAIHSKLNESIQIEAGKLFGVFPPIAWSAGMRLLRDKRPRGGSLAARGKRVYSGCGNRRGYFVSKLFSIDQIFTSKVLERTFETFHWSSDSFSCFLIC